MVVRIKTGKRIQGALSYNEQKVAAGKAQLILASRFGAEIAAMGFSQKLARFKMLTDNNQYVKGNTLHLSLNFSPNDQLTTEKMQLIAQDYMNRIGFGEQPFLVYKHTDTNHPHLHIVTTNIRANGRAIDMFRLGVRKSEPARKAMERDYDLIPAESMRRVLATPFQPVNIERAQYSEQETKRQISNVVKGVTSSYHFTNLDQLNQILAVYGVQADPGLPDSRQQLHEGLVYRMISQQGKQEGIAIKASAIDTKPTMKFLKKKFMAAAVLREQKIQAVQQKLNKLFDQLPRMSERLFLQQMDKYKIDITVLRDEQGAFAGFNLVDHKIRVAVTTTELGFDATELYQRTTLDISGDRARQHAVSQQQNVPDQSSRMADMHTMDLLHILLSDQSGGGGPSHGKRAKKKRNKP